MEVHTRVKSIFRSVTEVAHWTQMLLLL